MSDTKTVEEIQHVIFHKFEKNNSTVFPMADPCDWYGFTYMSG